MFEKILLIIFTAFTTWIVHKLLIEKPQIVYYISEITSHKVKVPQSESMPAHDLKLYAHSLVLENRGLKAAEDIEVRHFLLPQNYLVTPTTVTVREEPTPGGGKIIRIKRLSPREQIKISYVYFYPHTIGQIHESVRTQNCQVKFIPVMTLQIFPKKFYRMLSGLIWIGVAFIIFIIYKLLPYMKNLFMLFVNILSNK